MNPHDMRGLFEDALADPEPVAQAGTDDIVAAGRRSHRRRRAAQAGSGALATVAAVALIVATPLVLGQGQGSTAVTPIAGSSSDAPSEVPADAATETPQICPDPAREMTEEQAQIAQMYDQAVDEFIPSIGGEVINSCAADAGEQHGFYYDTEFERYRFEETALFQETGDEVRLFVDIHPPAEGSMDERFEQLIPCQGLELDCHRQEVPEGTLMLVENYYLVELDQDARHDGTFSPVHGALLGLADGTVIEVQAGVETETPEGDVTVATTTEQLGELAAALAAGQD